MDGSDRLERDGKTEASYLFRFLILANFFQYLEAGAVPALLLQLSQSFNMSPGQQVSKIAKTHDS